MKERNWLDAFLQGVEFSQWQVQDLPGESERLREGYVLRSGRQIPLRPDGFAIGNGLARAALSVRVYNDCVHTTALSTLFGSTYGHLILREPYTRGGGVYTSPYPAQDFILEMSDPSGHGLPGQGGLMAAEAAEYRFARRLLGTPMTSTGFRNHRVELVTLDFAPMEPLIPAIVRVVRVRNLGIKPINVKVYAYLSFGCSRGDAAVFDCAKAEPMPDQPSRGLLAYGTALGYTALNQRLPRNLPFVLLLTAETDISSIGIGTIENKCWDGILRGRAPKNAYVRAGLFDGYVSSDLGVLATGESTVYSFLIIPGESSEEIEEALTAIRTRSVERLAKDTYAYWKEWSKSPSFQSSSTKVDHLLDSLMLLERVHCEGKEGGIVAGTLNYGLGYWVRDGYYQARGLLKCGKYDEVRRNLQAYFNRVQRQGLSNCYHADGTAGDGCYNINDELPSLAILMVKDYGHYTGDEEILRRSRLYVKKLVNEIRLSERYLTIGSGDETWRIPGVSDTWAETPDNAFAAALALEFAQEVLGEPKYGELAKKVREGIGKYLVSPQGGWVHYRTKDGLTDERPITNIMARPLALGYTDAQDPILRRGIEAAWRHNRLEEGVVKHDTLATGYPGNAPGFMMYCLAEMDAVVASDYFWRLVELASVSGSYWEFYYAEDPNLSGERLRSWDSAVVLEGLLHYLYGISPGRPGPTNDGFQVAPHLPQGIERSAVKEFKIGDSRLAISVAKDDFILMEDGRQVLKANHLLRVRKLAGRWEISPIGASPPYLDVNPLVYDGKGRLELSPCFGDIKMQIGDVEYVQRANNITVHNGRTASLEVMAEGLRGQGSVVVLEAGEKRSFTVATTDLENQFCLLTPNYQVVETPQPATSLRSGSYILRGRAYYRNGLPFWGEIKIEVGGKERKTTADRLGYYECELRMPQQRGEYSLIIQINGQRFEKAVTVIENPMEDLDRIIAHQGRAQCCILSERTPEALRIAWEIWQEVLFAKDVPLPVVFDAASTEGHHLIRVGNVPLSYEKLAEYRGYSTGKIGDRYVLCVPSSNDVRGVQPFVNALRVHWRYPTRWKGSNLAKYGRILQEGIKVEVEAEEGVEVYIGAEKRREGVLMEDGLAYSVGKRARADSRKPYVSVHRQQEGQPGQGIISKLMIQADGDRPFKTKVRLFFPHSSIVRLGMPLYMDVKREIQEMVKRADGTRVVTVFLEPGRLLPENRVLARRTYREVEVEAFSLPPPFEYAERE